jgi:hypothetical protein
MFASTVVAAALAGQLVLVAGDNVPALDMRPTCNAAATIDPTQKTIFQSCMDTEESARGALAGQWLSFPAADRRACSAETQSGGPLSYVELLVCLEDAKAVRDLKGNNAP